MNIKYFLLQVITICVVMMGVSNAVPPSTGSAVIESGVVESGVVESGVVESGVVELGVVELGVVETGVKSLQVTVADEPESRFSSTGLAECLIETNSFNCIDEILKLDAQQMSTDGLDHRHGAC